MIVARAVSVAMCCRRYAACSCRTLHRWNHMNQYHFSVSANSIDTQTEQNQLDCNELLPIHFQPFATDSVKRILRSAKSRYLHEVISVQLLKALRIQVLLKKVSLDSFQSSTGFRIICEAFENGCDKLEPPMLISGLRSLLIIGVDSSSSVVEKAEKAILANISMFNLLELISCLHLHSKNMNTQFQNAVTAALVDEIKIKKFEIKTSSEALMLVQLIKFFGIEHMRTIEENIINVLNLMNLQEITKCILYLSEQGVRAKLLLKELCSHIISVDKKPSLKDSVSIMFSILSLNYFNQKLLLALTEGRTDEIAAVKQSSLISALLTACGQLRWRHSGLLDTCSEWYSNNFNLCSPRDLVSFILTLATLCYIPKDKLLLKRVASSLKLKDMEAKIWLDAVWATAILDCVDKSSLLKVVSSDFHEMLLSSSGDPLPVQSKMKLMNLMTVLKNTYPECIFSCDLFLDMDGVPRSEKVMMYKDSVLSSLKTFIPEDHFMATNLSTNMGITIDAEFIINKNGKPLPLTEYGLKAKPSVVIKNLPSGSKRIALMIWLHKDLTLNETVLTGSNALAVKLLSMEGYTVVQVPYEIFQKNSTVVTRAQYLSKLIKSRLEK